MAAVPPPTVPIEGAGISPSKHARLPMPSRNPIPLSASQEAEVRGVFYERVRRECQPEIKAFADCARGRTLSIPFLCRTPHNLMNACMKLHATVEQQDAAREEWFSKRLERARAREQKEKRKLEQQKFLREWWQIEETEKDAERRKKEEERRKGGERIGGFASERRRKVEDGENREKRENGGGEGR